MGRAETGRRAEGEDGLGSLSMTNPYNVGRRQGNGFCPVFVKTGSPRAWWGGKSAFWPKRPILPGDFRVACGCGSDENSHMYSKPTFGGKRRNRGTGGRWIGWGMKLPHIPLTGPSEAEEGARKGREKGRWRERAAKGGGDEADEGQGGDGARREEEGEKSYGRGNGERGVGKNSFFVEKRCKWGQWDKKAVGEGPTFEGKTGWMRCRKSQKTGTPEPGRKGEGTEGGREEERIGFSAYLTDIGER